MQLTRTLDLNFVIQCLSRNFGNREPVKAVAVCYVEGNAYDVTGLAVHFIDGSIEVYDSHDIDEDTDLEAIACLFYDELRELVDDIEDVVWVGGW